MRLKSRLLSASILATVSAALLPAAAAAQETAASRQQMVVLDIPAGPASTGLNTLATQADVQIFYPFGLVSGRSLPAIKGEYARDEAIRMVADAAGLSVKRQGDAYALEAPQSGSATDGADGTVEALIVTAQKREEDIQDVPIAISAFTQEDLTRSQVAGGPDLMTQVPNMTFTKTNFTSYSIQIRGIGTQAISATTDPAVAVAFNNTPFITNRFFEQEFYDLQRIEVLRGPQGTLYGRNATAGVVNVISAKPKFFYEAKLAADVANYSSHRLEGMINIPLVEDVAALRLAGAWTKRDGFVKNILTGEQTDGRNLWSGRVSLAIEPSDRLRADLIYEHFEEDDDRLRSGKQLCKRDPGPVAIGSKTVGQGAYPLAVGVSYLSQGCLPASMYSPESFQTPNGNALAYYGPAGALGSPVYIDLDPYASQVQSRDLREIETHIQPEYTAHADLAELQLRLDLPGDLTLASETGFSRDFTFSYQDFNRFDTTPDVFVKSANDDTRVSETGVFCDPQVGCTNRLAAADLATAESEQFSQELRLSSNYEGPLNFSLGANFLKYDTEVKYYVFINSLTAYTARGTNGIIWEPGASDNLECVRGENFWDPPSIFQSSDPNGIYDVQGCAYIDPNDIHNLNGQGRNYFLSKNPYELNSYAAFGELYYEISDALKATLGFRWTVDQKEAPQHPSWLLAVQSYGTPARKIIKQEWREPTGRVALDWKPELSFTDETLVYGSYVRGYKAGGANPPPPITVLYGLSFLKDDINAKSLTHPETFEGEFVDAYEIGTKNTLLDGKMTLNLGAFYYDYTGYQISQIVNRSAVNLNFDAEVWGLELEADWRPLENLRLGMKVGYENTRLADDSKAIDLMDRTAGDPDWVLFRPFPPMPSNCVLPVWLVEMAVGSFNPTLCTGYLVGLDPFTWLPYEENPQFRRSANGSIRPINASLVGGVDLTGYPGFDPTSANNGEGFFKDLSGNELPNAPHYTATLTADYTLPLPNEWLMTLHTDLYYQSEAWTRVFNTEGYDKLKAYTNVNLAAIFTNEDAGWNVMAYVKNVFDRDSITGAFLNSDDTGLTTNVFLTEPRLYGIRVTKAWDGEAPLGRLFGGDDGPHPLTLELGGGPARFEAVNAPLAPAWESSFLPSAGLPLDAQDADLDLGDDREIRLTYAPKAGAWHVRAGLRYGRSNGSSRGEAGEQEPEYCAVVFGQLGCQPGPYNWAVVEGTDREQFTIVDLEVGRDVGIGAFGEGASSEVAVGIRYAELSSQSDVRFLSDPDQQFPEGVNPLKYDRHWHEYTTDVTADRDFSGAGPRLSWDASATLWNSQEAGRIGLDWSLGGGVLFGDQKVTVQEETTGALVTGTLLDMLLAGGLSGLGRTPVSEAPPPRIESRSVQVPNVGASLGLSYGVGRLKVSGGYRWERYYDVLDGGDAERREVDRTIDGPYFKLSVGFGG